VGLARAAAATPLPSCRLHSRGLSVAWSEGDGRSCGTPSSSAPACRATRGESRFGDRWTVFPSAALSCPCLDDRQAALRFMLIAASGGAALVPRRPPASVDGSASPAPPASCWYAPASGRPSTRQLIPAVDASSSCARPRGEDGRMVRSYGTSQASERRAKPVEASQLRAPNEPPHCPSSVERAGADAAQVWKPAPTTNSR